ncbi:type II toxin-antitoxin system RelE/ParE family toxin [Leptolyngbya sp. O-77]|uniref:type II toxin-antitoxin system RelE/ParE family toxin n=1 Tax=Leptolyngbya sp. O-77 TaxID=1080068 RepID=UPI00074D2A78|nr:type II toxin-antitoxin system RelE/ParE family toxin [Leptolyngbya sp. O-77]BAU43561.1 Toxin ParE1 [Leptolyngbya sp. O-77]
MNRYRLSRKAEQDLENIWVCTANRDPVAADLMLAKILDRLPMLAQFPAMGRSRDELLPNLRSFPIKPYVVFYRSTEKGLEIIRILHQSRDVARDVDTTL